MANQPPLNPDGIEAAARALIAVQQPEVSADYAWNVQFDDGREELRKEAAAAVSAYLAAALPEVTSVEELEALPAKTVILDSHGDVSVITETGLFMCDDGDCYELDEVADDLPARVLYRPGETP